MASTAGTLVHPQVYCAATARMTQAVIRCALNVLRNRFGFQRAMSAIWSERTFHDPGWRMSRYKDRTVVLVAIVVLGIHSGCATSKPEMAWVRTDGRRILEDPALLKQGETDVAVCNANLDAGAVDESARKCMTQKGYALVRKDQAEETRAGFAAAAAQRGPTPSAAGR